MPKCRGCSCWPLTYASWGERTGHCPARDALNVLPTHHPLNTSLEKRLRTAVHARLDLCCIAATARALATDCLPPTTGRRWASSLQWYPARSQAAKPLSVEIRARPLRRSRRALRTRTAHSRDDFDADAADDARRVAVPTTPRSR